MHTIKLNVEDSVYSHLIFLLKKLEIDGLEIIEDKKISKIKKKQDIIDFSQFKVSAFREIKDPLKWQKKIRSEWE